MTAVSRMPVQRPVFFCSVGCMMPRKIVSSGIAAMRPIKTEDALLRRVVRDRVGEVRDRVREAVFGGKIARNADRTECEPEYTVGNIRCREPAPARVAEGQPRVATHPESQHDSDLEQPDADVDDERGGWGLPDLAAIMDAEHDGEEPPNAEHREVVSDD